MIDQHKALNMDHSNKKPMEVYDQSIHLTLPKQQTTTGVINCWAELAVLKCHPKSIASPIRPLLVNNLVK